MQKLQEMRTKILGFIRYLFAIARHSSVVRVESGDRLLLMVHEPFSIADIERFNSLLNKWINGDDRAAVVNIPDCEVIVIRKVDK